jgi:AraC family transcriptional regulator
MFIKITQTEEKILVGKQLRMSLAKNSTAQLWKSFMPHKKSIDHCLGDILYSVQVYTADMDFTYDRFFTKWAAIEVAKVVKIPNGFEVLKIPAGLYAVFLHKGSAANFAKTMTYIFEDWLPQSDYSIDNRPHFECLGEKYKNNDPSSKEEVWIPIKEKAQ